jgi:DNA-binding response OmpR family regulator
MQGYPKLAPCKHVSEAAQGSVKNCKFDGKKHRRAPTVPKYGVSIMTVTTTPHVDPSAAREPRVLLVDDDRELCQMLSEYLDAEHFDVKSVHDGSDALAELQLSDFDIVVLDVMLPSVSGLDVLRKLGASYSTPILMLTARGDDVDRIVGLELGADDYLSKPFNPRELVARIRAILRRASSRSARGSLSDEIVVGPITLNSGTRQVHVSTKPVALTGAEFRVLELLMRSAGQVISRDAMTEQALGRKLAAYDRSIDTHISNLRRKLELEAGKNPEIKNVRGSGYTLTWSIGS